LTTGVLPFTAASPVALATKHLTEKPVPPIERRPDAEISPAMDQLILRALSKNPAGRPQTALAFRAQLLAIERGEETAHWGLPARVVRSSTEPQKARKTTAALSGFLSGPGTLFFKLVTLMLLAASMGLIGYWFFLSPAARADSWVPPANAPVPGETAESR